MLRLSLPPVPLTFILFVNVGRFSLPVALFALPLLAFRLGDGRLLLALRLPFEFAFSFAFLFVIFFFGLFSLAAALSLVFRASDFSSGFFSGATT